MATITAQMVKELRERTGAGMLDCKKALEKNDGDIEKAIDYLREKGMATAAKKAGRIAAEGLTDYRVHGNEAIVFELNSETDFVAKNKQFLDLLNTIGEGIIASDATTTEEALAVDVGGRTIETILVDATASIGEKLSLRRVSRFIKTDEQTFGAYKHMGGRITSLAILAKEDDAVAKDIAMHIAAQNPRYLDRSQVEPETLEREKHVLTQQALQEGKPENIVEKMVIGRLNKFLQDICLVDQPFVKDTDIKVSQYLKTNQNEVVQFIRLEVGEGIEKRQEDFAAEVQAQLRNK